MYWDWVTDSPNPTKAAVFDPVLGFGSNGKIEEASSNNGHPPLRDGPFTSLRPTYWNNWTEPHYLSRHWQLDGFNDLHSKGYSSEVISVVNAETSYDAFRNALESGPHTSVHGGVGGPIGDMGSQNASPNDPLFFLHHAQVDRIWWLWQGQSHGTRTNAYNGNGTDEKLVSLSNIMPMAGLATDLAVRDVMDVKGGFLCYTY